MILLAVIAALEPTESPVVGEARRFMEELAEELRAGDRKAIAARYHRDGTLLIRGSERSWLTLEEVRLRYQRPQWKVPATFDWVDLRFDAVTPVSVTVTGSFDWTSKDGRRGRIFYHGLLVRDGERGLKLRVEDEARR